MLGAGDEVGFMVGQKTKHRAQYRRIFYPCLQRRRIQPGQSQQPIGPPLIRQYPCEREQGESGGVFLLVWMLLAIGTVGAHG